MLSTIGLADDVLSSGHGICDVQPLRQEMVVEEVVRMVTRVVTVVMVMAAVVTVVIVTGSSSYEY